MIHACKVEEASALNINIFEHWHFTCPVCKTRCRLPAGAAEVYCGTCKSPYKISSRGHVYSDSKPDKINAPTESAHTEIKDIQLQIAKAKLAQEQILLNQMQAKQESLANISKKVSEVGTQTVANSAKLIIYLIKWPVAAVAAATMNLIGAWVFLSNKLPLHREAEFLYQVGELAGYIHTPNLISIIIIATLLSFTPISEWKDLAPGAGFISAIIFGVWHFVR